MKKSLVIFYAIIIYAVAELIWWGYMLVHLNPSRKGMIMGEGMMFVMVFLVGAYFLHQSLNKEAEVTGTEKELPVIGNP
jgi:hypothetical protein